MDGIVVKYGGGALRDAGSFRAAAEYQVSAGHVALVSAVYDMTNTLMNIYDQIQDAGLDGVMDTYWKIAKELPRQYHDHAMDELKREAGHLGLFLDARNRDAFVGAGEAHSAILFKNFVRAQGKGAEHLAGPDAGFRLDDYGLVDIEESKEALRHSVCTVLDAGNVCIVGGYLGRHSKTHAFKLGARNSNDAFAAALAVALEARALEVVKDVPGVYRVPPEFGDYGVLDNLSYEEAAHMSLKGSPVVHPKAIEIATNNIPIVVKNMRSSGTLIRNEGQTNEINFAAALVPETAYEIMVLDRLIGIPEGANIIPEIANFEIHNGTGVFTPMSDMGWISYNISPGDKKRGGDSRALFEAHKEKLSTYLEGRGYKSVVEGCEVGRITIVGDGMRQRRGTFAHVAGILGKSGISILSALQGNEDYTPPVITINVERNLLEPSVQALARELFSVSS